MRADGERYRLLRRAMASDPARAAREAALEKGSPMARAMETLLDACLFGLEETAGTEGVEEEFLRHAVADELGGSPISVRRGGAEPSAFDAWESAKRAADGHARSQSAETYVRATREAARRAARTCAALAAEAAAIEGLDAGLVRIALGEALRR